MKMHVLLFRYSPHHTAGNNAALLKYDLSHTHNETALSRKKSRTNDGQQKITPPKIIELYHHASELCACTHAHRNVQRTSTCIPLWFATDTNSGSIRMTVCGVPLLLSARGGHIVLSPKQHILYQFVCVVFVTVVVVVARCLHVYVRCWARRQ